MLHFIFLSCLRHFPTYAQHLNLLKISSSGNPLVNHYGIPIIQLLVIQKENSSPFNLSTLPLVQMAQRREKILLSNFPLSLNGSGSVTVLRNHSDPVVVATCPDAPDRIVSPTAFLGLSPVRLNYPFWSF